MGCVEVSIMLFTPVAFVEERVVLVVRYGDGTGVMA